MDRLVDPRRAAPHRLAGPCRRDGADLEAFDAVLVHADPALVQLGDSFPAWPDIQARALYTGYVSDWDGAQTFPTSRRQGRGDRVGRRRRRRRAAALHAAIAARPLSRRWPIANGVCWSDRTCRPRSLRSLTASAGRGHRRRAGARRLPVVAAQCGAVDLAGGLQHRGRDAAAMAIAPCWCRSARHARPSRRIARAFWSSAAWWRRSPRTICTPASLAAAIAKAWGRPSIRSFPPVDARGGAATVAALKQMVSP